MKQFIKWLAKVFKVDITREVVKYKTLDENGIINGDLIIHGNVIVEGTVTVYGSVLSTDTITVRCRDGKHGKVICNCTKVG